jgi:hypothetical protein
MLCHGRVTLVDPGYRMRHLIVVFVLLASPGLADTTRYVTAPFGAMVSFTMPVGFHLDHANAWLGKRAVFAIPDGQHIGWETQRFSLYAFENHAPPTPLDSAQSLASRWISDYRQECPGGFRTTPLQVPRMRHDKTAVAIFTHCSRDPAETRRESTLVLFVAGPTHVYALEWLQNGKVSSHMNYARWYPRLALMARNFPVCKSTTTARTPYAGCKGN